MLVNTEEKAKTQPFCCLIQYYILNWFLLLHMHGLNKIRGNMNWTWDELMFAFNRTLVVLISADKNLKVSGLLLGEELPQSWLCCAFCAAPYFHSWKVEKMQRHMHRWSGILIGTQLFVSEWKFTLFSNLTAAIIVENLKLELAREYKQTGVGTIWGTGRLAEQTLANKTLDDWDAA